ncbi:MAG TPA: glutamine--tRNA ligase, partial [Spirochaetales bacterium]|nr:glutamine--tRNA ligase [Spirochaetales bacterium]
REVPFSKVLYIEQDDFMENPLPKYYRLYPGNQVRLRYGYIVQCVSCEKDSTTGEVVAVHCTYDPATRGGNAPDNSKVKSTIHWVSCAHAVPIEVRLYDHLFESERPRDVPPDVDWISTVNPQSLQVIPNAWAEPLLAESKPEQKYQFERLGYFVCDPDSTQTKKVFNRTITLKDTWAKLEKKLTK